MKSGACSRFDSDAFRTAGTADTPMGPREPKAHIEAFLVAYDVAKRLKTRRGLTPPEYICPNTSAKYGQQSQNDSD